MNAMKGQGRSWKVFSITGLTSYIGEKSYVWGGGWGGGLKDYRYSKPQSQFLYSGLWILDFGLGFGTPGVET